MFTFEVDKISKYRTELMGVATLLVLLVHAYDNGVVMPSYLQEVCKLGSLGVDIFLLVSGLGLWFSLYSFYKNASEKNVDRLVGVVVELGSMRGGGIKHWYLKRYKRILVPYVLISFPFMILSICNGNDIATILLDFSTLNFWFSHRGAWFVAMLIPLYFITPFHYRACCKVSNQLIYNITVIILLTILVSLPDVHTSDTIYYIWQNVKHVLYRLPSFFMGFALAPFVMNHKKISWVYLALIPMVIVVAERVIGFGYWPGFLVLPLIVVLCILFEKVKYCGLFVFQFFGQISLESYLCNVSVGPLIVLCIPALSDSTYDEGKYIYYSLVLVSGTFLAYMAKRLSDVIMKILK